MKSTDKRRAKRFPITLPVDVKAGEPGRGHTFVQTKDVSSTGVYFHFGAPLDVGAALEFVLTLPEEVTKASPVRIKCMGKVVRIERGEDTGHVGVAATIERYEFQRES